MHLVARRNGSGVVIVTGSLPGRSTQTDTSVPIPKKSLFTVHNAIADSPEGICFFLAYILKLLTYDSDLLVRHERLTHKKESLIQNGDGYPQTSAPNKRRRVVTKVEDPDEAPIPSCRPIDQPATEDHYGRPSFATNGNRDHDFLATLSFAAEQAALQDSLAASNAELRRTIASSYEQQRSVETPMYNFNPPTGSSAYALTVPKPHMPSTSQEVHTDTISDPLPEIDFEGSLESLAAFLDNGGLASYNFSSIINAEQPIPFFSPESLSLTGDALPETAAELDRSSRLHSPLRVEEPSSFSRFGSRLPSLQPEERFSHGKGRASARKAFADISLSERQSILDKLHNFSSVLSSEFKLPSRLALSRYLAAYISGFHEHLPFLHIPTMSVESCSVELILAMTAVGAQYCFESEKGVELFHASHAIASRRIRRRDARLAESHLSVRRSDPMSRNSPVAFSGPFELTSDVCTPEALYPEEGLIHTSQALLILMAMATWAKHKEILREALAIPSVLATIVREDGLRCPQLDSGASWEDWVQMETMKRTKFIVFCFFNLHCIVYNIPPLILNCRFMMMLVSQTHLLIPHQLSSKWLYLQAPLNSGQPMLLNGQRRERRQTNPRPLRMHSVVYFPGEGRI